MRQQIAIRASHNGLSEIIEKSRQFHIGKTWKFILGKGVYP